MRNGRSRREGRLSGIPVVNRNAWDDCHCSPRLQHGRWGGGVALLAARQAYLGPETGQRLKAGQKLGGAYLEANLPVVRRRLYQGGVRLAIVLNSAFLEKRRGLRR